MDTKSLKVPVQIRVNMWLGLSAYEKKFNSFSDGTFSVFAEMVYPHLKSSWQKSACKTKHFCFYCITVWEPSPGFREVGDYRTGGAPQILRCDRQTETEARVLHPSEGMEVGEWLVCWPRESVSMLRQRYLWCLLHFTAHFSRYSVVSKGSGIRLLCLHTSHTHRDLRPESRTVSPSWNLHTSSLRNSESEATRITYQHNLIFSIFKYSLLYMFCTLRYMRLFNV